ncbi:dimethylarginine dimethylaminohydrolase family protein [Priestia flexa]|uniref:dimethylarginine dimethylaminohydrolase family protein n=1 Tax=Priestia flexa TaxID=86664 RepID=UPI000C24E560|nr:dimethylarginine dimethylaminohydrolase family protein [Priestia flexa]MEC0665747.1 dimethylarginine dimethylaminohydrolase family protein [Priestia flexa]MED3823402.1 dimethylarginine dimethylaminohydrolase family protein [Priestia flexa]
MNLEKSPVCQTEYGILKEVIVCPPTYMEIKEIINETQKHYAGENIDETKASKQHKTFVEYLRTQGINVIELKADKRFPEQVFTRDIGYVLGHAVLVSKMGSDIREGEEAYLTEWLNNHNLSYYQVKGDSIEGGDVIIDGKDIYIGVSGRTTTEAIKQVQEQLPHMNVIPIPIKDGYLHLDCVFNIISKTEALIYPEALDKREIALLKERFDLIEVTEKEQFTLETNVFSIGNKTLISLPVNNQVNETLRMRGFEVVEIDISEIIKSGGSFRCCTLPLQREE